MVPKDIQIGIEGLPKTLGGGLKKDAVEDLLRRVQWDYARLYAENEKLKDQIQSIKSASPAAPVEAPPPPPLVLAEQPAPAPAAAPAAAPRREPDELARLALSAAHKAAREIRESARQDAEGMIRKARGRAVDAEREYEHLKIVAEAEIEKVARNVQAMREQLHALLAVVSNSERPPGSARANGAAAVDQALLDVAAGRDHAVGNGA